MAIGGHTKFEMSDKVHLPNPYFNVPGEHLYQSIQVV